MKTIKTDYTNFFLLEQEKEKKFKRVEKFLEISQGCLAIFLMGVGIGIPVFFICDIIF